MEGKVCQGKQGKAAIRGVFMAGDKNSTTSTARELLKPTMQRWRLPPDGRGPQARPKVSCSKHGVVLQPSKAQEEPPGQENYSTQRFSGPPPAFPLSPSVLHRERLRGARGGAGTRAGHMHIRGVRNHWLQNRSK